MDHFAGVWPFQFFDSNKVAAEHRVRNEDIESYGRCPIYKRNDRIQKVSAIFNTLSSLTYNSLNFAPPVNPIANEPKYLVSWVCKNSVEQKVVGSYQKLGKGILLSS